MPDPISGRVAGDRCRIRLAVMQDVNACVDLAASIGLNDANAWQQTLSRTVLDGVDRALFVAELAGSIVGYGRVVLTRSLGDGHSAPVGWYLLGLVVDRRWRRLGIGNALTHERIQWVSQRADRVYYFTQQDNNASQALHERFGFVQVAGAWISPGGDTSDATTQRLFVLDLRPAQQYASVHSCCPQESGFSQSCFRVHKLFCRGGFVGGRG